MKNESGEDLPTDLSGVEFAWESLYRENAELRQIIYELTVIAEYYHDKSIMYTEMPYKNWSDIISRAKSLLETKMK